MKKNIIYTLFLLLFNCYSYSMDLAARTETCRKQISNLLSQGLDPKDERLEDCLIGSGIEFNYENLMRPLLEYGVTPDVQQTNTLRTPLHESVREFTLKNVHLLLKYKANPNMQDSNGDTPLMLAVSHSYIHLDHPVRIDRDRKQIILELLQAKADNSIINNQGFKASDIARENGLEYLADLIEYYPNPIPLKDQCIRFIKSNRMKYRQEHLYALPVELAVLFSVCNKCYAKASYKKKLFRCGGCKKVYYCNKECQRKDWIYHNNLCKKK